jgi:hypothetical protein
MLVMRRLTFNEMSSINGGTLDEDFLNAARRSINRAENPNQVFEAVAQILKDVHKGNLSRRSAGELFDLVLDKLNVKTNIRPNRRA